MPQPTVFISYSHKDETEKNIVLTHLSVLPQIEVWSDDRIGAGEHWEQEIEQAIARAKAAILLITANFLASDFISKKEVPKLLNRHKEKGLKVFPIIVQACAWKNVEWLREMNVKPKNGRPVWRDGGLYINEELAVIAEEVADIIQSASDVITPELGQPSVANHLLSELQAFADLLTISGWADSSTLRELGVDIGVDPDSLKFLAQSSGYDFAQRLIHHLYQIGDFQALLRLCDTIAMKVKGPHQITLETIRIQLQRDASQGLAEAKKQQQLADLYDQGTRHFKNEIWLEAIHAFQRILDIDKFYKDASLLLAEAEKQQRLADLYSQGIKHFENKDWLKTIHQFEWILDIDKFYKDASQRLEEAKKQQQLADLYSQGIKHLENKDWQKAVRIFKWILDIDKFYKDASQRLTEAKRRLVLAQTGAFLKKSQSIVAVFVIMGLISLFLYLTPTIDAFVITDFDNCTDCYVVNDNRPSNRLDVDLSCPAQKDNCTARLEYEITEWSAFLIPLENLDITDYGKLTFDVKADSKEMPRQMKILLKRASGTNTDDTDAWIYVSGITNEWQTMSVDLSDPNFEPGPLSSLTEMNELVFTFEANRSGPAGVVYLDNIAFEP